MARIVKPLTAKQVSQAKPQEKEYTLSDGDGLLLSVRPSGSKTWLFRYNKPFTKKRTKLTLGEFPALSLSDAREKSNDARSLLAKDIDPKEYRDEVVLKKVSESENTLRAISEDWYEVKKSKVTSNYAQDIWRSFEKHIFPTLGSRPINSIKATQAIKVLEPIARQGSLETVKRLCQRINEVMTYAVNTGVIEHNPLTKIHAAFQAPKPRHMPSLAPQEISALMRALSTASIKLTTRCLIEWQLHTMTRPGEAAGARWDELNLEKELWVIPAERMKKGREHLIPLTEQTKALLQLMRPISGHRDFIFPSDRNPKSHANASTANTALKRMGFGGRLVAHGLRALASTTLNEQGFDHDVIEAALSHLDSDEVRRAYNRADYIARRRELMCWWSEHIEKASSGSMSLCSTISLKA